MRRDGSDATWMLLAALAFGCEAKTATPTPSQDLVPDSATDAPAGSDLGGEALSAETSADGTPARGTAKGGKILTVFFGLDDSLACPGDPTLLDGVPVVFDAEIDNLTIDAADFLIHLAGGGTATPACVTLQPAGDEAEDRTLLMIGQFGPARVAGVATGAVMESLEIVGNLCREGTPAEGNQCNQQSARNYLGALHMLPEWNYEEGASLPFAEAYAAGPSDDGDDNCPPTSGTRIRLIFSGGTTKPLACDTANAGCPCGTIFEDAYGCDVTGDQLVLDPDFGNGGKPCTCSGGAAGDCQAITALDGAGKAYHPFAFADMFDGDNNFELCFTETFTPSTVEVAEKFGYDPAPSFDAEELCRLDAHYTAKQTVKVTP